MELTPTELRQVHGALNYRKPVVKPANPKADYKARLLIEEGKGKPNRDGYWYLDPYKIPTIGIGHKIEKTDRKLFSNLFGKNFKFDAVMAGKIPLTDKQMDKLVEYDIDRKLKTAKRLFPKMESMSANLQGAVLDGVYRGDLSGSPDTIKLINQGKYKEAAKEYIRHEGYRSSKRGYNKKGEKIGRGIYKRMDRNAKALADEANKK